MVGEFPELQGIMGRYYALQDGEDPQVAEAIAGHYQPRFAGDALPSNAVGCVAAMADKMETLVGIWGIGLAPTGDKDPFALRRAALGVILLVVDNKLRLPLLSVFAKARSFKETGDLLAFFADRLKVQLREQGARHDLVDAVFALEGQDDLLLIVRRVEALGKFLETDDGANLLAGYKRAANIVRAEEKKEKGAGGGNDAV